MTLWPSVAVDRKKYWRKPVGRAPSSRRESSYLPQHNRPTAFNKAIHEASAKQAEWTSEMKVKSENRKHPLYFAFKGGFSIRSS
jgi:hypothetical protein